MVVTWREDSLDTEPVPRMVRYSMASVVETAPSMPVRALGTWMVIVTAAALALIAILW